MELLLYIGLSQALRTIPVSCSLFSFMNARLSLLFLLSSPLILSLSSEERSIGFAEIATLRKLGQGCVWVSLNLKHNVFKNIFLLITILTFNNEYNSVTHFYFQGCISMEEINKLEINCSNLTRPPLHG